MTGGVGSPTIHVTPRFRGLLVVMPPMTAFTHDIVKSVLLGVEDPEIRYQFVQRYESELETFVSSMVVALGDWEKLDSDLSKDINGAHVSALVYGALNTHLVAMKLLISGLFVPSGNSQRYVLESIATALLASKPELGVLRRYSNDEYSTKNAVRDVKKHAKELQLNHHALEQLSVHAKFYGRTSHPTLFASGSLITLQGRNSQTVFGGHFDVGKTFAYDREIASRTSLAAIFPSIIFGIRRNYFGAA